MDALQRADLYPYGVHVVHEGDGEQILVEALVASLLGAGTLEEVSFTDLGGAGNTGVVAELVGSLNSYARRVVVILDSEARARTQVEALIASGGIGQSDVLLFETSLEEASATDEELTALASDLAAEQGRSVRIIGSAAQAVSTMSAPPAPASAAPKSPGWCHRSSSSSAE